MLVDGTSPVEDVVCVNVLKGIHHLRKLCQHFQFREWTDLLLQKMLQGAVIIQITNKHTFSNIQKLTLFIHEVSSMRTYFSAQIFLSVQLIPVVFLCIIYRKWPKLGTTCMCANDNQNK